MFFNICFLSLIYDEFKLFFCLQIKIVYLISLCTCRLLANATERARAAVEEQKEKWQKYGCSILSDGWTDGKNRTIINFLVACKEEVVFLKSVDASHIAKSA